MTSASRPWALFCLVFGVLSGPACSGVVEDGPAGAAPAGGAAPGGSGPGTAPGASPTVPGGAGGGSPGSAAAPPVCKDSAAQPAPLRRLTRFEYDNTIRDLLVDTTSPGSALPAEVLGNGFGNDVASQAISSLLAEQYAAVAASVGNRAVATPGKLAPCAATVTAATEESCARTFIEGFASRAFRRSLAAGEADELLALFRSLRALGGASFASASAGVIEAVLQAPDFLYRVEQAPMGRLSGDEMATRLSYFLWGSMPDDGLRAAARAGRLGTAAGVESEAVRMIADPRARAMIRFFFDNVLPIAGLNDLERAPDLFPTFSSTVGTLMREETQRLIEHEIFDGSGTWTGALTAPHTFLNGPLAAFYKVAGVDGAGWRKSPLDGKRLGLLTHGSVMAGTTHSSHTNPVVRGAFVSHKLLCNDIPLPDASIAEKVKPPDPYSGKTARERFSKHSQDSVCAGCHALMDPIGFAFENFDAVGLYRTHENDELIDASGGIPGVPGTVAGPVELIKKLAATPQTHDCFVTQWLALAFGKTLGPADDCLRANLSAAFRKSGYDVKKLLVALTQTDAFLRK